MKELMHAKFFNNEINLIQTDEGTYTVSETGRNNEITKVERVYEYENMDHAFSRYIKIVTDHLMTIIELLRDL